jgi:hypothetical protein
MASQLHVRVARPEHAPIPPPDIWPEGFAQHKLCRLLELRAVVDAMRGECEARDPLLAWVKTHARTDIS